MTNAVFTVTTIDANGCTVSKTTNVYSEDDRCFVNGGVTKFKICHRTGNPNDPCHELCVAQSAVAAHLAHGDFMGSCTANCVAPPPPAARVITPPATNTYIASQLEVNVMPNPTTTVFNLIIKGKDASPVTVRVMDATGKVIQLFQKIGSSAALRLGNRWTNGTYFVEVMQGNERKVLKLIKAN